MGICYKSHNYAKSFVHLYFHSCCNCSSSYTDRILKNTPKKGTALCTHKTLTKEIHTEALTKPFEASLKL